MHRTISLMLLTACIVAGCGSPPTTAEPTSLPASATAVPPTPTVVQTDLPTATATPSPKPTSTPRPSPTPIAGITEPIMVNDVGIQVKSAVLGVDPPIGQQVKAGYKLLAVTVEVTGNTDFAELAKKFNMREVKVIDQAGDEGELALFNIDFSPKPPFTLTLTFAVKETAQSFTLRLPDGQAIDLAPLLKTQ